MMSTTRVAAAKSRLPATMMLVAGMTDGLDWAAACKWQREPQWINAPRHKTT